MPGARGRSSHRARSRGGTLCSCIGSGRAGCRADSCGRRSRPATSSACCPTAAWTCSGTGTTISIAGPDTHAQLFAGEPGSAMTGLRFAPGLRAAGAGRSCRPSSPTSECRSTRCGRPPTSGASPSSSRRARIPDVALEALALRCCAGADENAAIVGRVADLARAGLQQHDDRATGSGSAPASSSAEHRRVRLRRQDAEPGPAHAAGARTRARRRTAAPTRRRAPATRTSRTSPAT